MSLFIDPRDDTCLGGLATDSTDCVSRQGRLFRWWEEFGYAKPAGMDQITNGEAKRGDLACPGIVTDAISLRGGEGARDSELRRSNRDE